MPIPFRDAEEIDTLGSAAFLRFISLNAEQSWCGALFLVNARSEPLEFTYNRIEIPHRFLWRKRDLLQHAVRRIATSLFEICPRVPAVLLCRGEEVEPELFTQEISVGVPVARVAIEEKLIGQGPGEEQETVETDRIQLFWVGGIPPDDTNARRLVARFAARGMLLEPFDRAAAGLHEVYGVKSPQEDVLVEPATTV
ncbi:MAG: hypothetical protein HY704_05675 [Gemmatimonadetes bacterium]|nr:hypothetical protein [Gemmatimonadota bacterium]